MSRYILMSFKPLYAFKIINNEKDCEVRTYFGNININDIVLIYASTPIKAIIGMFRVKDVVVGKYNYIKQCITRICTKFDEENWDFVRQHYELSNRKLILIKIGDIHKFHRYISLEELRKNRLILNPPLSYRNITEDMFKAIFKMIQ